MSVASLKVRAQARNTKTATARSDRGTGHASLTQERTCAQAQVRDNTKPNACLKHSNFIKTDRIGKATAVHIMQRVSSCSTPTIVQLGKTKETRNSQVACSKTRGKIKVTCRSQGKGLTVTSACDLGETCHLGLYLLHAVIAQGGGTSPTSSRMHQVSSLLSAQSTTVKL